MTYDQDPARWSTDPDEAPELLRGAFSAGRKEGPDRTHMRALAVKLAAASAGGAVAVGTVKAASAGNTIATAATWSAAKIAGVIAVAGSVVTGAVVFRGSSSEVDAARSAKAPIQAPAAQAPAVPSSETPAENVPGPTGAAAAPAGQVATTVVGAGSTAPTVQPLNSADSANPGSQVASAGTRGGVAEPSGDVDAPGNAPSGSRVARSGTDARRPSASKSGDRRNAESRSSAAGAQKTQSSSAASSSAVASASRAGGSGEAAPPTEISLLRSAQVALQARPREAFQLTQQHRKLYPSGVFAQERDALAIQALMRSGDTEQARSLAQAFIRSYPSSPHAHRFREAMGIR